MHCVRLPRFGAADAWREAARALAVARIPPEAVAFRRGGDDGADLFATATRPLSVGIAPAGPTAVLTVPRAFPDLARSAVCHADPGAPGLLYRLLWRLQSAPGLLGDRADPDVARVFALDKAVRREIHKMHAFVRFRELPSSGPRRRFAAWHEPAHNVTEAAAPFFARRFADMDWAIATPEMIADFTAGRLTFGDPVAAPALPADAAEGLWTTYFENIFNPARLKVHAMKSEMPVRFWKNMPETRAIPAMIAAATGRTAAMRAAAPTAPPPVAERLSRRRLTETAGRREGSSGMPDAIPGDLSSARRLAAACTRCGLCRHATQTVFGEGPEDAPLMVVGEQPGDQEDLAGRPFVGPAGQLFDRIAAEAGLDRSRAWVTNAVKHFKFAPRGKRRIHQRPDAGEVEACRWWLDIERRLVRPKLVLAMGATAALSLTGNGAGIGKRRGRTETGPDGVPVLLTWHPSFILRVPDDAAKAKATAEMRTDLALAAEIIAA